MNTNLPWVEKYRPTEFSDVIGDTKVYEEMIKSPMNLPNLLLYGEPGTGKTTIAKIIINKLKPADVLRLNGSDTTGVDTIRDKVYNFITGMSSVVGKPRIVWIEEIDFLSDSAFAALRSMMEQYCFNARFIATCNYLSKVPAPIIDRFKCFEFSKQREPSLIFKRIEKICELEKINCVPDTSILIDLIKGCDYDIRNILNSLQVGSLNGTQDLKIENVFKNKSNANELFELIKAKDWTKIRYEFPARHPDYPQLLVELDRLFFESGYNTELKAAVTEIISDGLFQMRSSFNYDICFAAICSRIMKRL